MKIYDIRYYGDPILRKKAKEIKNFNNELKEIVNNMFATMYKNNGVGLAANQVGILERIVVIDTSTDTDKKILTLINPEIIKKSNDTIIFEEGCLSFPGLVEKIERHKKVKVKFQDLNGRESFVEAEGLLSVALQHEIDHLDGILFIDRMTTAKKSLHNKKLREIKKLSKKSTV